MASPPSPYSASPPSPYSASYPSPADGSFLEYVDWSSLFTAVASYLTLLCYGWFVFLILLDLWGAITKWATWLPGKAFSLSGVTVQIIVWWTSVSSITKKCKNKVDENDWECKLDKMDKLVLLHQLLVSGKAAVCVFIGYLLPGMAAPSVTTFLVLGLSICVQLASEFIIFYTNDDDYYERWTHLIEFVNEEDYKRLIHWMKIANIILFTCIIVLGLVSVCTISGSQTFRSLLKQRAYVIFSKTNEYEFQFSNERTVPISWNDFDDEVLSSWLVARVCRADYVISRSFFSSAAGVVVTCCVIISLLSNTPPRNVYLNRPYYPTQYFILSLLSLLFTFIIIGWIVICWRWLAAQLYFHSHGQSWRRRLSLDDFWTRNTVELIHMYDLKKDRQQFPKRCCSLTKIFTKLRLHKLVYLVWMLQLIVVFLRKLCGLLTEFIIGRLVYCLRKLLRKGHAAATPEKYKKILKLICMPGEDSSDLWEANEMSFNQVKHLMVKGCEKGRSSEEINSIFHLYSKQWAEDGEKLLNTLETRALPLILNHFPSVEKQYLRITVVSLMTIFTQLHKVKSAPLEKVLKACCQVWDFLSFADECDIDLQANDISLVDDLKKNKDQVGMAAEREFYKLQRKYEKLYSGGEGTVIDVQEAHRILQDLLEECKRVLKKENLLGDKEEDAANLSDSKDWVKIAPKYNLYKLCRLMLDEGIEDFVAWTENALKDVITYCMSRLPDMLVKQCWKWAQEFEEDKLWQAADLAGKCKGMMEAWEPEPKMTRNTTKRWTIQGMQSV